MSVPVTRPAVRPLAAPHDLRRPVLLAVFLTPSDSPRFTRPPNFAPESSEALRVQETLADEMSHRVKNVLALTAGMVRLSAQRRE
jgi:two-component sensor histidine kinase